jgi:type III secretion system FlhB-like substrate exporter
MEWVRWNEAVDRFGRFEGEFVGASSEFNSQQGSAEIVLRVYPRWEHPAYRAASGHGSFRRHGLSFESFQRPVRISAEHVQVASLSRRPDWSVGQTVVGRFTATHPRLWRFLPRGTIALNGPCDPEALLEGLMALELPWVTRGEVERLLAHRLGQPVPYSLVVREPLFQPILDVLARLEVPAFGSKDREPDSLPPVMFLLGDGDFVIAGTFWVDLPEFLHDLSWFEADTAAAAKGASSPDATPGALVVAGEEVAVSLRYAPRRMRAPEVADRGWGAAAGRILAAAKAQAVPVHRDVDLAYALFRCAVGAKIPADLFPPVAAAWRGRGSREDRSAAVADLAAMRLPVRSPSKMKEESVPDTDEIPP